MEDVPEIRRLVRLAIGNHHVYESASAEDALNQVADLGGVDLLVLDIMLSGSSDGLALLATVRAHPIWSATKVIMLTARGSAEDRAASAVLGADAYFTKPFSPLQLNDCIDELLSAEPLSATVTHRFET